MNKKLFKVLVPMFIVLLIILFYQIQYSRKSFEDFLGTNEANITKILMRNGSDGSYVETSDKEHMKILINMLNDRYYKKSLNQEDRNGYSYYYDFYLQDKRIIRITGDGDNVNINNTYYNVSKQISLDSLTNWYNSLSVNDYQ